MSPIKINDTLLPVELTNYDWGIKDLDGAEGTGRSESTGVAFRDRIAVCRIITIDVGPTTVAEMSALLHLVEDEYVWITYLDAHDGDWRTDEFYVADRGVHSLEWDGDLEPGVSTDFSGVTWAPTSLEFVGRGNPVGGDGNA